MRRVCEAPADHHTTGIARDDKRRQGSGGAGDGDGCHWLPCGVTGAEKLLRCRARYLRVRTAYAGCRIGACGVRPVPQQQAAVCVTRDDEPALCILTGTRHRRCGAAGGAGCDAEVAEGGGGRGRGWGGGGGGKGGKGGHGEVQRELQDLPALKQMTEEKGGHRCL